MTFKGIKKTILGLLAGVIATSWLVLSLTAESPEMATASGSSTGYVSYTLEASNHPTNLPTYSGWTSTPIHEQTLNTVEWTYRAAFLETTNHDSHASLTNTDPSPFIGNKSPIAKMAYLTIYVRTSSWAQLFIKGSNTYSDTLSGYSLISTIVLSATNGGAPGEIGRTETIVITNYAYIALCGGGQIIDLVSMTVTCTPDGTASTPYGVSSTAGTLTSGQAYFVANHHYIGYNTLAYAPMDAMKFANNCFKAQDTIWTTEFSTFPVESSWTMVYLGHDETEGKDIYAFLNNKTGYFLYFNGTTFACSSYNATYWYASPTADGGYKFSTKIAGVSWYLNRDKNNLVYTAGTSSNESNHDYVFYFFALTGHFMNADAWAEAFLVATDSACSSGTMNATLWATLEAVYNSGLFASAYEAIAATTVPSDPAAYATASALVKAVWRYRTILTSHSTFDDFAGIADASLSHPVSKKPNAVSPISTTLIVVSTSGIVTLLAIATVFAIEKKKRMKSKK